MLKRGLFIIAISALLGGCAMKEFSSTPLYTGDEVKFTGAVEDRVNLWPLAYWREPVGSVAWPFISFGDEHFALRPVYSMYKTKSDESAEYDEFNFLWPISQFDTRHRDYRVFPFFWGEDYSGDYYISLFPLLFWGDDYFVTFPALWWVENGFAGVFPFFWSLDPTPDSGGFAVFPLFWSETLSDGGYWNTLFPLYYIEHAPPSESRTPSDRTEFWALAYLAGFEKQSGKFINHRFLPFYFAYEEDFYSLPYSSYDDGFLHKRRILAGLAGYDTVSTSGEYESSWVFPLYYHDTNNLITPLFGQTQDAAWLFPLFYHDGDNFLTPLYGRSGEADWLIPLYWRNDKAFLTPLFGKSGDAYWLLPLFYKDDYEFVSLLGGGGKTSGDKSYSWLLPLYYWEEDDGFYSLLYSRLDNGAQFFFWFLAGIQGENRNGGWLFPLFYRSESKDFDLHASWLDLEKLPEEIQINCSVRTNYVWNAQLDKRTPVEVPDIKETTIYSTSHNNYLLLCDNENHINGYAIDMDWRDGTSGVYRLAKTFSRGNIFAFSYGSSRAAYFDLNSREKLYEKYESSSNLLLFLYNYRHEEDGQKNTSYTKHRVLWKIWDWEEENGDVSLDVFPAFTYDSKKSGYTKTSFFWRLFRYESTPEGETSIDLLFIPIWR